MPRRVQGLGRHSWAGTTKHLCHACKQLKGQRKKKWLACKDAEEKSRLRAKYESTHKYFRAFSPGVLRHYEEQYEDVASQMNEVFLHRTAIDAFLVTLNDVLIPHGTSPDTLSRCLKIIRDQFKDRLQVAHYSFQGRMTGTTTRMDGQKTINTYFAAEEAPKQVAEAGLAEKVTNTHPHKQNIQAARTNSGNSKIKNT